MTRTITSWMLSGLLFAVGLRAQTALPEGQSLLGTDTLASFFPKVEPAAKDKARLETVAVTGPGFSRAWRVATLEDTSPMAAIELRGLNTHAVKTGQVSLMRFFIRATEISDETGGARVMLVIRRNGVDWNSSFEGDFPVTREWQEVLVPFVWSQDFEKDGAAFMLRFGFKRQTVEVGGLEVIQYGTSRTWASLPRTRFSYAGRESEASWRKAALERIEQLRKREISIRVLDERKQPIPHARVSLVQTRSAFQWGSALQMERLVVDSPDNLRYRQVTEELFNAASTENDLKWPVWAGEWGAGFSQEQTLQGLRWLRDRGFHVRGHVLVWPGHKNLPKPVQEKLGTPKQSEIPEMVLAHIREIARATKGIVQEWDALNEPFTNHDLMTVFGDAVMPPWFKLAREELPDVPLYLNDFSNHDATTDADHVAHFERTARYLLDQGAPLDGLGLQAHFNGRPNAPENILAVLDRYYSQFKLPVRITEFDVWTLDEELQADFTRDFLILSFSHPSVVGVQYWGFWETCHWRPSAAMFRADWTEKPNAKVYRDWVMKAWRTQLNEVADRQGRLSSRGFHGDYQLTVEHHGKKTIQTFSLPVGQGALEVTVTVK